MHDVGGEDRDDGGQSSQHAHAGPAPEGERVQRHGGSDDGRGTGGGREVEERECQHGGDGVSAGARRRPNSDPPAAAPTSSAAGSSSPTWTTAATMIAAARIRRVGAVLESGDFDPGRSGRNHLRTLALAGEVGLARADEVLALVELTAAADRAVRTYSLGMRQRLGLADALPGGPELLVIDEPTDGLDPAGMHWLRGFLRQFADAGGTALISSHVLSEIAQTVDSVLILSRGRLVAARELAELEDLYLELIA
jgi:ABC-type lipoprotein export system ATPase subunit